MPPENAPASMEDHDGKVVSFPNATPSSGFGPTASEDAIAASFTARHKGELRFDADQGKWYRWNGNHWQLDNKNLAFNFARLEARRMGQGEKSTAKAAFAAGVERFARADPVHAVDHNIWDRDSWLLGTPAGTVDLRTGKLRPGNPSDFIAKITSVAPASGPPEKFLTFLGEACRGNEEVVGYIQRLLGYCLTGEVSEHVLILLHGPGGNGKSVLLNTVRAILGGYSTIVSVEMLNVSKYDRHPTELAALHGMRFALASETEANKQLAEAKIKYLTGGDPINARFMRCDFFSFNPTHKLIISGNHLPNIRTVDDAIRRRVRIIPFTNKPTAPDRNLEQDLISEHGQILTWLLEGTINWQRKGLNTPKAILDSTSDYLQEQDVFGIWLQERCNFGDSCATLMTPVAELLDDFQKCLEERQEPRISAKEFGAAMKRLGYSSRAARIAGVPQKVYAGIGLRP